MTFSKKMVLQGSRGGYDMGQRPSHVGHLPQQPLGDHQHQSPSESIFRRQIFSRSSNTATDPPKPLMRGHNHDTRTIQFGDSKNQPNPVTLFCFPRTILVICKAERLRLFNASINIQEEKVQKKMLSD